VAFLVRIGHLGNAHWVDVRNNDRAAYFGRRDVGWGRPQMTAWPLRTAMGKLAAFCRLAPILACPLRNGRYGRLIQFERLLAPHFTALRADALRIRGNRKDRSLSTPRRPAQRRQGVRSETIGSFSERSG
jgi:hypothetical protein